MSLTPNVLSQEQRDKLLESLSFAPDDVLIDAVRQYKDWRANITRSFDEVRGYIGMRITETARPPLNAIAAPVEVHAAVVAEVSSKNVKPFATAAAKALRTATIEAIKSALTKEPRDLEYMMDALRMSKAHCQGILLAAWERGLIEYDGRNYRSASK